jgi:hypothetical protein
MDPHTQLADRYIAVWNETDPARRRSEIAALWSPDGEHHVRTLRARGHDELERRVASSHEKNVRDLGYRFRRSGAVQPLHDSLMFHWEMFRPGHEGVIEALGLQFFRLATDKRIAVDYQFILPTPVRPA